jgi:signal transduction histidine kinase
VRLRRPSALTVLTSALLILLPTLAVLQYGWVGQVHDAERERMERNLRIAALQFRDGFDEDIGRAVVTLRLDAATVRDEAWDRYADRYETWTDSAADARVVAGVYLVDAADAAVRLRRWNTATHTFDAAEWSSALAPWRPHFERLHAAFTTGDRPDTRAPLPPDNALLAAPLVNAFPRAGRGRRSPPGPVFGYTVVHLDMDHIQTEVLPALVQRHFSGPAGNSYRVAVATREDAPRVIYQSDPSRPVDLARADATEPLHTAFSEPAFAARRGRGRPEGRTNVIVEVFGTDGQPTTVRRIVNRDAGRWTLFVQHERGSLDAAVAALRRRNLVVSFGTLLLLTISVALLTMSSRRAHRLAQQQMEVVAGVSHELRTPVAVIRSAAENLAQGVVSGDRVKRYGAMIETEARRLGDMVERVMQYGGLESGVASRVPVAPADVVAAAIDAASPALGSARVDRRLAEDLPLVMGDAGALRSAVQNLIVNAAKYGGDGWVGVTAERAGNGKRPEVRITVEDRGPGIPAAELPHIFDPFYRGADAIARQVQGSGLGLSLVKRIVTSHGGRVDVEARPSGGTSFTITLPVQS